MKKYNKRIDKAIKSFRELGDSVGIIGKGRTAKELTLVLVEKGNFAGYGFIEKEITIRTIEEAREYVQKGAETNTVQNLINSYLLNPKDSEIISF
ncbi:MAG: hypothetical protein OEU76_08200 [Cyclobacteriaceae bacterium]|nr:hypothetical protein [Cyclobacteriaceae bacterium]